MGVSGTPLCAGRTGGYAHRRLCSHAYGTGVPDRVACGRPPAQTRRLRENFWSIHRFPRSGSAHGFLERYLPDFTRKDQQRTARRASAYEVPPLIDGRRTDRRRWQPAPHQAVRSGRRVRSATRLITQCSTRPAHRDWTETCDPARGLQSK
jgi:hypothetical protein